MRIVAVCQRHRPVRYIQKTVGRPVGKPERVSPQIDVGGIGLHKGVGSCQPVQIMFQQGKTIRRHRVIVSRQRIRPRGIFPNIRHSVLIRVCQRRAAINGSIAAIGQPRGPGTGDDRAGGSQRSHLADHQRIQRIARQGTRVGKIHPVCRHR